MNMKSRMVRDEVILKIFMQALWWLVVISLSFLAGYAFVLSFRTEASFNRTLHQFIQLLGKDEFNEMHKTLPGGIGFLDVHKGLNAYYQITVLCLRIALGALALLAAMLFTTVLIQRKKLKRLLDILEKQDSPSNP